MANKLKRMAALSCVTAMAAYGSAIAPASAQSSDENDGMIKRAERMLEHYDANGDGEVTLEEYLTGGLDRFSIADADNDGFATKEELLKLASNPQSMRAMAIISHMDTDKDGKVSLAEAKAMAEERAVSRFEKADTDGDGFITPEEAGKVVGERREYRGGHHAARGAKGAKGGDEGRGSKRRHANKAGAQSDEKRAEHLQKRAEHMATRMLQLLDTDGDDRISMAESESRRTTTFAQIDKNNDGKIVVEEFAMSVDSQPGHGRGKGGKHHKYLR